MYDSAGRLDRWRISSGELIFQHAEMKVFWEIPDDFVLPSKQILGLAEYVLLTPFKEDVQLEPKLEEMQERLEYVGNAIPIFGEKTNVGVAFSGGIDSTAVLQLLPNTIPIYTQVSNPTGMHKIENALLSVKEVGGIAIVSNCDELPQKYGRSKGFYGDAGFTTTAILFSKYYNIHTIADGNVLERMYLFGPNGHGTEYKDQDLSKVLNAYRNIGLEYCIPCAGMTEILTTLIADKIGLKYSMGCMRGIGGDPCNNCLKCFRKRGLQGTPIPSNKETDRKLDSKYIPMLVSLLWAKENKGLSHPVIDNISKDISWADKWYEDSLKYIPTFLHQYFLSRLEYFEITKIIDESPLINFSSKNVDYTPN